MIKFMLITIAICWLFMFLFPPILKFIKGRKSKKEGSSTDEGQKTS